MKNLKERKEDTLLKRLLMKFQKLMNFKMPEKLKKKFEKEYGKKKGDRIFYGYEANLKKKKSKKTSI